MANSKIVINVGINPVQAVGDIQDQLDKDVAPKLRIDVPCHIDTKNIQHLQTELNDALGGKLSITIGKIDTSQAEQSIDKMTSKMTKKTKETSKQITNSLSQIANRYTQTLSLTADGNSQYANRSFKELTERLSPLGEVDVRGIYDANNNLNRMIATVKALNGETRTFEYELQNIDRITKNATVNWSYIGSSFDDAGVGRKINSINKFVDTYTQKLATLRSNVGQDFAPNIAVNIGTETKKSIVTLDSFEKKLNELKQGKGNVTELRAEFVALDSEIKRLKPLLRDGKDSLNPFTNAINSARNFGNEIKSLEDRYKNLGQKTKDSLTDPISNLKTQLAELDKIQSSQGYTDKWITKYRELQIAIKSATEDIKVAKQIESQNTTKQQKAELREIASAYQQIQKYTKVAYSATASQQERDNAKQLVNSYRDIAAASRKRLSDEGLLTKEIENAINNYERLLKDTRQMATIKNSVYRQQKEETALVEREATAAKQLKTINSRINGLTTQGNNATFKQNVNSAEVQKQISNINSLQIKYRELLSELNNAKTPHQFETITAQLKVLDKEFITTSTTTRDLQASLKNLSAMTTFDNKIKALTADMNAYALTNKRVVASNKEMSSGMTFAQKWNELNAQITSDSIKSEAQLKHFTEEMKIFKAEANSAGLTASSAWGKFLDSFKQISTYISAHMVFSYVTRAVREMVTEVKALDDAMTELRKVTVATSEQFDEFKDRAKKSAQEYGATVSEIVNSTSTFSRLGYKLEEAEELGKIATLYKNVGDGITEEQASEDLISTMKAFKIEAKDAITIVDKFNEVGNNFAISSGGIGEALKRSASALASANNDLAESIAIITTANTIVQDPDAIGTGVKTMSLRLRSTKTELEEMGEDAEGAADSVSKLRQSMLDLTGVDIMLDENTYKSSYQILLEMSKVWDGLKDTTQANVLEQLFGKRQANIGAAILENGRLLEEVYETANEAAGSATREQEEYAKSVNYAFSQLKAAVQGISDSIVGSDLLVGATKSATAFLNVLTKIVDTFGALPPILVTISAVMAAKGKGIFATNLLSGSLTGLKKFGAGLENIANYAINIKDTWKNFDIRLNGISDDDLKALQEYVNLLGKENVSQLDLADTLEGTSATTKVMATHFNSLNLALEKGIITQDQYDAATRNLAAAQKGAATTSKALSVALNLIANVSFMIAITLITKAVSALVDKLVVTREELDDIAQGTQEQLETLAQSAKDLRDSGRDVQDLVDEYKKIISTTDDVSTHSADLLQIQDKLNEQYKDQKANLDLLNDSYDTTIAKVKALADEEYNQWKQQNQDKIDYARQLSEYNIGYSAKDMGNKRYVEVSTGREKSGTYTTGLGSDYDYIKKVDETAASLFTLEVKSKEIRDLLAQIDEIKTFEHLGKQTDLYLTGTVYDALDQLTKLKNLIEEVNTDEDKTNNVDNKTVQVITSKYNQLAQEIKDMEMYNEITQSHEKNFLTEIGNVALNTSDTLKQAGKTFGEVRSEWYNGLDDIEKNQLSNITRMTEALQSLANGDKISFDDFWQIDALDTGHILSDIQSIDGEMTVSMESLYNLKDQYIKKMIKEYEDANTAIEEEHQEELNNLAQYQSELEQIQKEIAENNIDINQTVFGNINTNNRQTLEWTEQNLDKYSEAIKSWGLDVEELAGSVSTILGTSNEFDGVEIAFSPMLQTAHGAVLLNESTVNKYIWQLINNAGEGWTNEDLLKLDAQGIEVDGIKIRNIIADIGDTAIKTGQAMHYVGMDGALETAKRKFDKVNESAKAYTEIMRNNNLMVEYLNTLLGDTVNKQKAIEEQEKKLNKEREQAQKELDALNTELDNRLKAQQYVIDQYIDKFNDELAVLEADKKVMEDELDVLNKQKESIEEIISNYEKVNSLVGKTINKEKKALEEQRDAVKKSYDDRIEAMKNAGSGGEALNEAYNDLIAIQTEIADKGIDISKTVFGNIDTNARQLLEWTDETLDKYSEAIGSWGYEAEELAGSISTVMGASAEFDGVEIAFSPMLQTDNGAVLLSENTVTDYINGLIDKAGEGWTNEKLFALDGEGLEIEGTKVKNLLADIGDTAMQTGEAMHYVGENGALAIAEQTIEALKVENEERQASLEYAQKLANLENAKNRKVRVRDETKGWVYGSIREDVEKAQKELDEFNNQKTVKRLEKQRDDEIEAWEKLIKQKEDYAELWTEWLDEIQDEEAEALAQELLGADWREKITKNDENLLSTFSAAYRVHNTNLQTLTKTEIRLKEEAIKAKQAEIEAKKEQIQSWQNYKTEVEKAVQTAKDKASGFMQYINDVLIPDEKASLETRENNLRAFTTNVNGLFDQMQAKESIIQNLQNQIDSLHGGDYTFSFHVEGYEELNDAADAANRVVLAHALEGYNITNMADAVLALKANRAVDDIVQRTNENFERIKNLFGFAKGGVADYTGVAMLHGTKQKAETIFNANDSAKLYDMIHNTPNLMADMVKQAVKITSNMPLGSTTNNAQSVSIGAVNVYANNPQEFARNLDKTLDSYFRTKLTQSYTGK